MTAGASTAPPPAPGESALPVRTARPARPGRPQRPPRLAPRHDRSRNYAALDDVARRHRGDDHRAGRDLDVVAELDVRLDVNPGAETDTIAQNDKTGGRARWSGRDVRAEPVVMVVGVERRKEVVVAHDGADAEVAKGADDVARAERHACRN